MENVELVNEIKNKVDGYKADIENVKENVDLVKANAEKKLFDLEQRVSALTAPQVNVDNKPHLEDFRNYLKGGAKFVKDALSTSTGAGIAPTWYSKEIIEKIANETKLFQLVRKLPVPAIVGSFPISAGAKKPVFTNESTATQDDDQLAYASRTIEIDGLKTKVAVTERLVKLSGFNVEDLVESEIVKVYAQALDEYLLTGTSNLKGLLVADAEAVPTSQDVLTAGATINADLLYGFTTKIKAKSFNPSTTVLIMHPTIWNAIRTAKASSSGVYLIGEGIASSTFDGVPIILSNYATATSDTNDYIATIADLSKYTVGVGSDLEISVQSDLDNGKIVYYPRIYLGGKPMDVTSFYRLKVTAS